MSAPRRAPGRRDEGAYQLGSSEKQCRQSGRRGGGVRRDPQRRLLEGVGQSAAGGRRLTGEVCGLDVRARIESGRGNSCGITSGRKS